MSAHSGPRMAQHGMVLITSLLLLIVVTILAVAMFRSFGLDEKIAGNVREKHRALNAAETAEQYAEWWLSGGNGTTGVACAATVVVPVVQVCNNLPNGVNNVAALPLPWTVGVAYTPPAPSAATAMNSGGGWNAYANTPMFYITYLGPSPTALPGVVYQIDASGFAGSADTAAVVESTYLVQQSSSCLSCNQ
jgi:type IV pilus assembly protein PilX